MNHHGTPNYIVVGIGGKREKAGWKIYAHLGHTFLIRGDIAQVASVMRFAFGISMVDTVRVEMAAWVSSKRLNRVA